MTQKIYLLFLSTLAVFFLSSFSYAATPSITFDVQDDGGVVVTATGTYATCVPPQSTNIYIELFEWGSNEICSSSSGTCSVTLDRATLLTGTNSFTATAGDCTGHSSITQNLTINNTPQVTYGGPTGTVSAPFDITGTAVFTPTLGSTKGNVSFYIDGAELPYTQTCYTMRDVSLCTASEHTPLPLGMYPSI